MSAGTASIHRLGCTETSFTTYTYVAAAAYARQQDSQGAAWQRGARRWRCSRANVHVDTVGPAWVVKGARRLPHALWHASACRVSISIGRGPHSFVLEQPEAAGRIDPQRSFRAVCQSPLSTAIASCQSSLANSRQEAGKKPGVHLTRFCVVHCLG